MRDGLAPNIRHVSTYKVEPRLTVPHLFPGDSLVREMPEVLATGFLVALMERACMEAMAPYLDPGEMSLGVAIQLSHQSPTLAGMTVTLEVECTAREGRRCSWRIEARDEEASIGSATHDRVVVSMEQFNGRLEELRSKHRVGQTAHRQ